MRRTIRITAAVLTLVGAGAARLDAQTASAPTTIPVTKEVRGQIAASINNAGLQETTEWSWKRFLNTSQNILLSDAHVAAGTSVGITPASLRGGAWAEVAPVSFFVLKAGVDPSQYFGNFDSVTSFANRTDAFDTDARQARANAKAGRNMKFYLEPTLQMRAGKMSAQSSLTIERWSSSASGPFFYEPTRDTLLAVSGDHLATWSTVVLFEDKQAGGVSTSMGPMYSVMRVHGSSVNQVQKIGAVMVVQTGPQFLPHALPRVTVLVSRYLEDPSKQGQWSAAVAVGFNLSRR